MTPAPRTSIQRAATWIRSLHVCSKKVGSCIHSPTTTVVRVASSLDVGEASESVALVSNLSLTTPSARANPPQRRRARACSSVHTWMYSRIPSGTPGVSGPVNLAASVCATACNRAATARVDSRSAWRRSCRSVATTAKAVTRPPIAPPTTPSRPCSHHHVASPGFTTQTVDHDAVMHGSNRDRVAR